MIDQADNFLVDLADQDHLHHIHGLAVGHPHAMDIAGLNAQTIEQFIDLRSAAMDDHRVDADLFQQDHIQGELFFQMFIDHGMAAIFDDDGFMPEFLHIGKCFQQHVRLGNTLCNGFYHTILFDLSIYPFLLYEISTLKRRPRALNKVLL